MADDLFPRWPKMTEIGTGVNSPGSVNAFLLWQQVSSLHNFRRSVFTILASPDVYGATGISGITDQKNVGSMG